MAPSEFAWLADLHKSQCYTTGDWNNPAKTIDFGDKGHTASLTDWHELLQLTAPDPLCGIVFIRGDFPNTADAILARAQQRDCSGKKGTFGLEIDSKVSDFVLGEKRNQGFVNFRWPYVQYELKRRYSDGGVEQIHVGTYEAIWFVRDGTVYQVICLRPGKIHRPPSLQPEAGLSIKFKFGGNIRFGCSCCTGPRLDTEDEDVHVDEAYRVKSEDRGERLVCSSSWYQKHLEMQLFVNDESRPVRPIRRYEPRETDGQIGVLGGPAKINGGSVDISGTHDVEIEHSPSTFIVSTYALRDSRYQEPMLEKDSFKSIADYLGVRNDSERLSDRLWTACLTTNYDAAEAMEFCAIGTAVEQTLCVSSVPPMSIPFIAETSPESVSDGNQKDNGIALIRNIMFGQYVDLQSTFWQIRLLAKVHEFLRSRKFATDILDTDRPLNDIRSYYLEMLKIHVQKVLIWLLEAVVEPGEIMLAVGPSKQPPHAIHESTSKRLNHCFSRRRLLKVDNSYDHACFVSLAVWFVMKHCPEAITLEFKVQFVLPALRKLYVSGDIQDSKAQNDASTKNNILHWFDMSCLLLICQESFGRDSNDQDITGFAASGLNHQDIRRSQEQYEKAITRLRKGKPEAYSIKDEEVDRLFLLAEELGFQALVPQTSSSLATARAKQTRTKIAERKPTIRFHLGPKPFKSGNTFEVVSSGPWELSSLNHHSILRTTLDRSFDINVQECRDACFEFLLSDYSFMSSWDRADKAMIEKWWEFETASVICVTVLDLKTAKILKAAEPELEADNLSKSRTDVGAAPTEDEGQTHHTNVARSTLPRADSLRDLLQLLKQELLQNESGSMASSKPFDWLAWKPARNYHPKCWVNLLNGVTKMPKLKSMKKVPSQLEIIKYLSSPDENNLSKPLESHMEEIGQLMGEDLNYISIFDLVANYDFTFRSREHQKYDQVMLQSPPSMIRRLEQPLHENTVALLNRTLVDSGTKYRILYAERCSPPIFKAFVSGWHPDAVDTFDDYFGASSRFLDSREAMWTTTITISHWSIQETDSSKVYPIRFHEGRIKGDFPPPSIANLKLANGMAKQGKAQSEIPITRVIEERSTSMVFTGDSHGFFWICTIWSSLTKHRHLIASVNSLPAVLQSFIHQQASGRCLVFLILLGHLCERLAKEHERMLNQLNTVVDLGEKILLDGIELEASDAVERLERMLWGLEALRVFDDRLSTSLLQIRKARETLEHTIDQESAQQDVELVQEYKNVLEEFGKRYCILRDVQIKIQLRIRQVTGLRDGISTVTNVKDSRAALRDNETTIKQGNNIRVLTLITIAYLPLGFVTSLFSNNQNLLPEGTGTTLYIILSVCLSIATYIVALFLGTILNIFQPGWDNFTKKVLPRNAEGSEIMENGAVMKHSPSNGSHSRSRSAMSGSQRGNILPLTKEHDSNDTNV